MESTRGLDAVEICRASQGRVFPGEVHVPPLVRGESDEEKEERIAEAVREARTFEYCVDMIWTDGSRTSHGRVCR